MPEILLVLAVILIFFGAKKLPELAKGMGQGIKEFKKATRDATDESATAIWPWMNSMVPWLFIARSQLARRRSDQ